MKTTRHITRAIPRSSFCILHSAFCIALAASAARAATLPAGYTELAYIESTGSQYIDTGLTPTPNFRAVVDFQFPSPTGGGGFGYGASGGGQSFRLYRTVSSGTATYTVNIHNAYGTVDNFPTTYVNDTSRHVADISNTSKSFDGVTFGRTSGLTKTLAGTFYLFATRQGWTSATSPAFASYRIYFCQLYDGTPQTLVRNFVPCTDEDGKAGLYDLVEGKMYRKAKGDDFVLGPATDSSLLTILSSPRDIGSSSPAYGDVSGLAAGDSFQCSAPAVWTNAANDTAATCTGWKLYDAYGVLVSNGASNAFTYTHPGAMRMLEWQWDVEYKISATAGAGGAVSPAEQWVAHGGTATVAATADQGQTFLKWTGDAPASVTYANPAVFVVTFPREMAARFGDLRQLPAGYRRVAYIESTGTQYLDTGFTPTRYARAVVDFQFPSPTGGGGLGYLAAQSAQSFWFWRSEADGVSTFIANVHNTLGTKATASSVDVFPATFTNDTARHVADLSDPAKSFDGVPFGRTSGLTKTLAGSLYLFASQWGWSPYVGNYGSYRVYSFKFYESGNLVGYLLPCTDGNGKPGLYDTVNWEMHYNKAKGADFLRGPSLPFCTILMVQ